MAPLLKRSTEGTSAQLRNMSLAVTTICAGDQPLSVRVAYFNAAKSPVCSSQLKTAPAEDAVNCGESVRPVGGAVRDSTRTSQAAGTEVASRASFSGAGALLEQAAHNTTRNRQARCIEVMPRGYQTASAAT